MRIKDKKVVYRQMPNEETEHSEKRKPCICYEEDCEAWAGCPCVYYKPQKVRKKNE